MRIGYIGMILWMLMVASSYGTLDESKIDKSRPYLKIDLIYNYAVYKRPIFFAGKSRPSFSIWIHDQNSKIKETIFVTYKAGKKKWKFTKHRPESIPVWYGMNRIEKEQPTFDIDTVSGATPKGEKATIYWQIPHGYTTGSFDIFIEANNSFDFNEAYHKKKNKAGYSGGNGQPSVVYQAELNLENGALTGTIHPKIIGHGDLFGKKETIQRDISKITTAAQTFQSISIEYISPALTDSGHTAE